MHAHVCSMGTLGTSLATTSEQPHMRYAYRKPNAGIVCIRRRRISFYSFFRCCVFRSASNHLRTYLRSRDYCQIYNGYLLICAVLQLYPRSFSRCAYRRRSSHKSVERPQTKAAFSFFQDQYENETKPEETHFSMMLDLN